MANLDPFEALKSKTADKPFETQKSIPTGKQTEISKASVKDAPVKRADATVKETKEAKHVDEKKLTTKEKLEKGLIQFSDIPLSDPYWGER